MFTAKEANERTLKVFAAKHADMFAKIEEAIDEQIEKENTHVLLHKRDVPNQALDILRNLGYKVIDNGAMALVSWALTDQ